MPATRATSAPATWSIPPWPPPSGPRCSPGLPQVSVDVAQLEAAVLNLVANSCDAMPQGGHIVIRTGMEHAANPFVPGSQARDYVKVDVAECWWRTRRRC